MWILFFSICLASSISPSDGESMEGMLGSAAVGTFFENELVKKYMDPAFLKDFLNSEVSGFINGEVLTSVLDNEVMKKLLTPDQIVMILNSKAVQNLLSVDSLKSILDSESIKKILKVETIDALLDTTLVKNFNPDAIKLIVNPDSIEKISNYLGDKVEHHLTTGNIEKGLANLTNLLYNTKAVLNSKLFNNIVKPEFIQTVLNADVISELFTPESFEILTHTIAGKNLLNLQTYAMLLDTKAVKAFRIDEQVKHLHKKVQHKIHDKFEQIGKSFEKPKLLHLSLLG